MCFKKVILKIEEVKDGRRFFVEENNKTAYLYVMSFDFSKVYSIGWIANYTKAPVNIDIKSMGKGLPPRMHVSACTIPDGISPIKDFAFEWLDETSFAIKGDGETVAVVADAFSNEIKIYSKYLSTETRYGVPMKI